MPSICLCSNVISLVRLKFPQLLNWTISNPICRPMSIGGLGIDKSKQVTVSKGGGGFTADDSIDPVKIAYTSYESTNPMTMSSDCPIIIMHGLLGSKNNWNSLSKVIHSKTKRKVIAVDARNHGDSTHSPKMTYAHHAEDVRALMKDLNIKKAALIGHSMGGRTMMFLSLKYPELVEKLVVVDISPVGTSPSLQLMPKYFDAMDAVKLDANVSISAARKSADEQLSRVVPDPGVRQFILTNLVEAGSGRYKWRIDLFSIATNFNNMARFPDVDNQTFDKPTLFIAGGKSDYIKPNDHLQIKTIFPTAKFETISNAGHWVHAEKPTEFVNLVSEFMSKTQNEN